MSAEAPASPLDILGEVFGYNSFRGPQEAIVNHAVAGGDALVLMPTGGGKSLCYQIPAIARQQAGHGVTIVISPLIALMHDRSARCTKPVCRRPFSTQRKRKKKAAHLKSSCCAMS